MGTPSSTGPGPAFRAGGGAPCTSAAQWDAAPHPPLVQDSARPSWLQSSRSRLISSTCSGLCPGGKQEDGPKWRQCRGTVCLPMADHEAPRFCPSFRTGASSGPPALFQFRYTHCLKMPLSPSERNAGMKIDQGLACFWWRRVFFKFFPTMYICKCFC